MRRIVLALLASSALCSVARAQVFDTSPSGGGGGGGGGGVTIGTVSGTARDAAAALAAEQGAASTATSAQTTAITAASQAATALLTATAAQTLAVSAKGVLQTDNSISIPVVDTNGNAMTVIIQASAVTVPAVVFGWAENFNSGHVVTSGGSAAIGYVPTGQGGLGYPSAAYPVCAADNLPFGWPSGDASNFTNRASWVFGSTYANANTPGSCPNSKITTNTLLHSHFENNQVVGNANTNVGGGKDKNPGVIWNWFRQYTPGDPHDTTPVLADGLHLRAFCNGDPNSTNCQGDGNTYTGVVRSEIGVNDSDLAETCLKRPDVPWAWITNWYWRTKYPDPGSTYAGQFYGQGTSPGSPYPIIPAGAPNNGAGGYAYYSGPVQRAADEIDWPDGFPMNNSGQSAIHDLYSVNAIGSSYSDSLNIAPVFGTNAGGFTAVAAGNQYAYHTTADLSQKHCYQVLIHHATWTDPSRTTIATHGSVSHYLDGQLYSTTQADIGHDYALGANGLTGDPYTPYSWMVAYQIPGGAMNIPNSTATMTRDAVAASDAVVYSMKLWHYTGNGNGALPLLASFVTPPSNGAPPAHYLDVGSTGFGIATSAVSFAPITGINQISINVATLPAGDVFLAYGYNASTGFGPIFHRKASGELCLDVASQGNYGDTCIGSSPNSGWLTAKWAAGTYNPTSPAPEVGSQASGTNMISFYSGAPGSLTLLGSKSDGYTISNENPSTNVWIGSKSGIDNANPAGTYFLGAQMFNNGTKIVDVDFTAAASGATSVAGTTGGPFTLSGGASIH